MPEYDGYENEQLEIKMMPPLEDTTHPNYVANPNVSILNNLKKNRNFWFQIQV